MERLAWRAGPQIVSGSRDIDSFWPNASALGVGAVTLRVHSLQPEAAHDRHRHDAEAHNTDHDVLPTAGKHCLQLIRVLTLVYPLCRLEMMPAPTLIQKCMLYVALQVAQMQKQWPACNQAVPSLLQCKKAL